MSDGAEDHGQEDGGSCHHDDEGHTLEAVTIEYLENRSIRSDLNVISATKRMKKLVNYEKA